MLISGEIRDTMLLIQGSRLSKKGNYLQQNRERYIIILYMISGGASKLKKGD